MLYEFDDVALNDVSIFGEIEYDVDGDDIYVRWQTLKITQVYFYDDDKTFTSDNVPDLLDPLSYAVISGYGHKRFHELIMSKIYNRTLRRESGYV